MKKAAALLFSVLFYIAAFALAFICASEQNLLYFACILPPIVALYFVIAGNIFSHRLGLNRWLDHNTVMVCVEFCWRDM